jgi:ParB-like chromosome segregation protein Spo0J
MTGQLKLLAQAPPECSELTLHLNQLVGYHDARPRPALVEQVGRAGRLLQRAVVSPTRDGAYEVIEGRRRTKAIELNAQSGRIAAPAEVHVLSVGGPETTRREVRAAMTLMLHGTRSPSIATELKAIEEILAVADGNSQATTLSEIAAATGVSLATVRKRMRLTHLIPALRAALDDGSISGAVAEAAARLSEAQQQTLADRLAAGEPLTAKVARELTREQTRHAAEALPGALFGTRTSNWQADVAGHLRAARSGVPEDAANTPLAAAIQAAIDLA